MSVINQMLNNIEQREQVIQDTPTKKLDVLNVTEPRSFNGLLLSLLVIIILMMVWFNRSWFIAPLDSSEPPKLSLNIDTPVSQVVTQKQPELTVPPVPVPSAMVPPREQTIQTVDSEKRAQQKTPVIKSTAPKQTIAVPILKDISKAIPKEQEKASLSLADTVQVEKTPNVAAIESTPEPSFSITPVSLTASELAMLKYQQGRKLQREGQLDLAKTAWRDALQALPSLHKARESLAASYYGANNVTKALNILHQGNKTYSQYDGYRLLIAQIYFQQQQPQLALSSLAQPYLSDKASNEALALAGSLAQQLKRWSQAQRNYQRLNQRQPTNAKWLIGLAISLDAQQQTQKALAAYQSFMAMSGVDKSLYQYAHKRASTLKKLLLEQAQLTREQHG